MAASAMRLLDFDFEQYRGFLFGLGYRLLGSAADAEDLVQDTYLRAATAASAEVSSPRTYLATIATRLGLDRLKSARTQREFYPGPWLPEPLPGTVTAQAAVTPEEAVTLEDSISLAFMVMLESMTPPERAAFVLHEAFGFEHREIAEILEISDSASRQHVHRARQHLAARRQRFSASRELRTELTKAFLAAVREGEVDGIVALLAEDVTAWSDGGGKVAAALNPIHGADRVARFYRGIRDKWPMDRVELVEVNGVPGVLMGWRGRVQSILVLEPTVEGRIGELRTISNPEKTMLFWRRME